MQFVVRDKPGSPGERELAGVDWVFNAWGGLTGGLYKDWRNDDMVCLCPALTLCHQSYAARTASAVSSCHMDPPKLNNGNELHKGFNPGSDLANELAC